MDLEIFGLSVLGGIGQGLLFALVAIGTFLTYRVMKFADLTCEGSFMIGGVIAMTMMLNGMNTLLAITVAMLVGAIAGVLTGLIHTKLKIDGIIAGLIVTMGLFSIALFIMGTSSVSAPISVYVFTPLRELLMNWGIAPYYAMLTSYLIWGLIIGGTIVTALYFLFKTSYGLSIRATGSNERMARANGINTDTKK